MSKSHVLVVADGRTHLGAEHIDLVDAPAHDLADRQDGEAFHAQVQVPSAVPALLFELPVLWPWTQRDSEYLVADVFKASAFRALLHDPVRQSECAARFIAGVIEQLGPFSEDSEDRSLA